jgi:hypothetical protein
MRLETFWWWWCGLKRSRTSYGVLVLSFETLIMVTGNVAKIDVSYYFGELSRAMWDVLQEK